MPAGQSPFRDAMRGHSCSTRGLRGPYLEHPSAPGRPYGFVALFIITASSYRASTAT